MNSSTATSASISASESSTRFRDILEQDKVVAVVRAPQIPDVTGLARTLATSGVRAVEFTFTTPGVEQLIQRAASEEKEHRALIGAGTVLSASQAELAINSGAKFLVTPGVRSEVAQVANQAGIPVAMGAMTPSEVAQALDYGASVVKLFPARHLGLSYVRDLLGPYPHLNLLASGGIDEHNAADFLAAGVRAVCCGSSVLPPDAVADGDFIRIGALAAQFVQRISVERSPHQAAQERGE